jgi:NAD(P)-dependent dehydrogenase (short-subunit alcohol dehydrogenase family)
MKVQNKVLVVTGGGSGMGRELVFHLLSKGARVVAIDINETTLNETSALAGPNRDRLFTFIEDITDKISVESFRDKIIAQLGSVDGIINNAGIIQPFVKVNELSYEAIERVMQVNFYGTLYMTKTFSYSARSAYCKYFQYGRLFTGARANHLWGNKSSGETFHGGAAFRTDWHECSCNHSVSRCREYQHFKKLRHKYARAFCK